MKVESVRMPEELRDEIKSELEYGDTLSEWLRDAARGKLNNE